MSKIIKPPAKSPNSKKPFVILFNYGGGMRGLIPAHFMQKIEETTGLCMADMVDVFAGPSTGSILNAALNLPHPFEIGKPKYRARHMVRFYEREGIKIFPRDAFRSFRSLVHDFNNRTMRINQLDWLFKHGHYEQANIGRALRALYGRAKLSDSLSSLVIPVYNIGSRELNAYKEANEDPNAPAHGWNAITTTGGHAMWLKNIKFNDARHVKAAPDVSLYDSVMASTAAPTYFPCHTFMIKEGNGFREQEVSGIDGSVFDNPCISYLGALRQHIPEDREVYMIVLGTGYTHRPIRKEDWNRLGSLGVVDPNNDMPLINILFHASESALIESFADELGANLFVFNKSMVSGPFMEDFPDPRIDDASPENLRRLKNFFEMMLEENRKKFTTICDILIKNHEARETQNKNEDSTKDRILKTLSKLTSKTIQPTEDQPVA